MILGIGLFILLIIVLQLKTKKYSFEKEFRKCESPIEEKMMKALYENGYKPYAQIPCRGYRIDIAIYYKGKKIAIECDGKAFHSSNSQLKHDETKDRVLKKEKWRVLRITGSEIHRNVSDCVNKVNVYSKKKS